MYKNSPFGLQISFFSQKTSLHRLKFIFWMKKKKIRSNMTHITLRDLLTQKCVHKKTVTDFRYPRACRFRKHQFKNRSPELALPTLKKPFFVCFFEISHFFNVIVLKLFLCVPRLEKRENSRKKFENRSIGANFSHIL
jgi:hypothetical protein